MRNSLWLALMVVSVSCSSGTVSMTSLEYLKCPTTMSTTAADTGASGPDSSLFGSSSMANSNNCTTNPTICNALGTGFTCNSQLGCCVYSPSNVCSTADKQMGNAQCATLAGSQGYDVLCIGGACHECLTNADCHRAGKANCNTKTFTCGACTDDSQCASNICKVDASLLVEPGDSPDTIGDCAKPSNVVYVDNAPIGCNNGDGTMGNPFCQINAAIVTGKPYIRVVGHGSGDAQIYNPVSVGSGQKVVILGPSGGRDLTTNQVVINGVNVTGGGSLTIQDVAVVSMTPAPAAVQCTGSTLFVKKVSIMPVGPQGSPKQPSAGIVTTGCKVDLEKSKVYGALGYGVWISGGSDHRVVNNAIILNGLNGFSKQPSGMKLTGITSGQFSFNTIAGNGQGVQCDSAIPVTDSIVMSNGADPQLTMTNCQQTKNVTMGVTLDSAYMTGGDPKLMADPSNLAIDQVMQDLSVQDDYYGNPRGPMNKLYDIGFQEVR